MTTSVTPAAIDLSHDWYPGELPDNIAMGERCWLYSAYAFHHYRSRQPLGVRIGHDTGIYIGTMFCLGPDAVVEIGDYCTIAGAIFSSYGRIRIGHYAFVSYDVVITDSRAASPPEQRSAVQPGGAIIIGDNVWIGARALIIGQVRIGDNAIIGASAVVDFDVPANAIVAGNPARIVGWSRREARARA